LAEINVRDARCRGCKTQSSLTGKRVLRADTYNPTNKEEYVEFIYDETEDGSQLAHSSDPQELDKQGVPAFETPIYFRKAVLEEYYHNSDTYKIGPSCLKGPGWSLDMDNMNETYVVVCLGYIGEGLPYKEQLHWKRYNIPPCGPFSKEYSQKFFLGDSVQSLIPEHIFKRKYGELIRLQNNLNKQLLKPLENGDQHYLDQIRTNIDENQSQFDKTCHGLAKVLVDSINVQLLPKKENETPIKRLERFLQDQQVCNHKVIISYLQTIQNVKSAGVSHRKGGKYDKALPKIEGNSLVEKSKTLINMGIEILDFFMEFVSK
jgi:hypothetical protein